MWIVRILFLLGLCLNLEAEPLKLVCWNIHHGVGEDGRLDLKRIAEVIRAEKPDLVALQEVDQGCSRSGKVKQAEELGRLLGMKAVFGKAMDFGGGEYGLAVLSALPVLSHEVHRLPGDGEPRIALEVRVKQASREFSFVSVHLDHQDAERRQKQARHLHARLAQRPAVILCGDFNDVPKSETMKVFGGWQTMSKREPVMTSPAGDPRSEIDHILLRGLQPRGALRVLEEKIASDHRPLAGSVE
jgi:endonuclease/exonuclease/phosphatase family metal-dependent hydrolase